MERLRNNEGREIPSYVSLLLMVIVIAVGTLLGFQSMRPPQPPAETDPNYPAYQRMLANLEAMTVAPHPAGSAELETVRAYLLDQIQVMGLEATVESETYNRAAEEAEMGVREGGPKPERGPGSSATPGSGPNAPRTGPEPNEPAEVDLKNILVKLDAPGTERGVLMLAHYDSEEGSPGASDDMVSVCAWLEALREQSTNPNLQNDLYFLLTDGEELGAQGAKAFVEAHPELQDSIDLVINLESRGSRGGLLMFETSTGNEDLLHYFQSASSRPLAFSFTTALYRRMPNGTDLTTFLEAGYAGLNFAVAEGVENYHLPSDSFENLDRGTAYNFLQTALEMAGYAAQMPFEDDASNQDSVFFTLLPGNLVIIGQTVAYFLSGLALLAAGFWLVAQVRSGMVRLVQVLSGTGWLLGSMVLFGLLSWGVVSLAAPALEREESFTSDPLFLGQVIVLGAGALAFLVLWLRKRSLAQALAGILPLQMLLILGTTLAFVEVSYLFTLPTLGLLIVAVLERRLAGKVVAGSVVGVAVLLLYVPTGWLLYVLFMLPAAPLAIALGVNPIAMIAACFVTNARD